MICIIYEWGWLCTPALRRDEMNRRKFIKLLGMIPFLGIAPINKLPDIHPYWQPKIVSASVSISGRDTDGHILGIAAEQIERMCKK